MLSIRRGLLFGVLSALLTGCSNQGNDAVNDPNQDKPKILVGHADDESQLPEGVVLHKSRDPDAPARVQRTPVVLDDPAEVRRTRQIFEQGLAQLYDQAVVRIAAGDWVYSEHTFALTMRREQAVADLRRMIGNESLPPSARTKAAENLIDLQDAAGETFLLNLLQSESADLRLASLESLRSWEPRVDLSKPDRSSRALTLLSDPDERVALAAAKLCTFRSIRGTESKLVELLKSGRLKNPGPFAFELAEIASTKRAVDALLPHVFQEDAEEFSQWTGYAFDKLIEHPDPEVSGPARRALYEYTLRFSKQRYDQILVEYLAKAAGPDAIPVLEDVLKNAGDTVSRTYAVAALARLQPETAIDGLIDHIRREGARSDIVRRLRKHASEADFDRIAPVLVEWSQRSGKPFDDEIVRLFLTELGSRGEQFVKVRLDELTADARMWAAWKLEGLNLVKALEELHAAGVIQSPPNALLDKMQQSRNRRDTGPLDTSDPDALVGALIWDGTATMFDVETSTIPCHHDRLILDLAEASHGQFAPEWPIQFWHRASEDDYNGPYSVQFVVKGRVFRTGAENYGDWYDVDAIVRLINFALETGGQPQRFITLDSEDQIAAFVFADPAAFLPIAEKCRLPLSDDPSKAMRQGIEFERRVLER
jgi:HEAT repeat protein